MSATTKKKHVTNEILNDYPLPDGKREVVKVVASRGNNLHEVSNAKGEKFLVSMPSKFRKHVWIKRGDFILVEPIDEGDKVKAEISHILFKDQVKHIQDNNLWPEEFCEESAPVDKGGIPADFLPPSDSDEEGDDCINVNRVNRHDYHESESEESSEEEDEEEDQSESFDKECGVNDT